MRSPSSGLAPGWAHLAMGACGMAPIAALCFHLFGLAPLPWLAWALVAPALFVAALLAWRWPRLGRLAACAWLAGALATAPYDAFRLGLVHAGLLGPDPIPRIGVALGLGPEWWWGYLWRFAGNGAGMGLAFACWGGRGWRAGLLWGSAVCAALLFTLWASPHGQSLLFPLNWGTAAAAWVGHLIYGGCLGALLPPAQGRPPRPQKNT